MNTKTRLWRFELATEESPKFIHIVEFEPTSIEYDWMYLTIGMSSAAMPNAPNPLHRIEILLYSKLQNNEIPENLYLIAAYPFVEKTYFNFGHTIAGSDGTGIVEGSPLTDILFTPIHFETEGFDVFQFDKDIHVHIMCAVPIYQAERAWIKENGWRALVENVFNEKHVSPGDFFRPCAI